MATKGKQHDFEPGTNVKNAGTSAGDAGNAAKAGADTKAKGQRVSRERGVATRSKKNPGKRPSQGGNSR